MRTWWLTRYGYNSLQADHLAHQTNNQIEIYVISTIQLLYYLQFWRFKSTWSQFLFELLENIS